MTIRFRGKKTTSFSGSKTLTALTDHPQFFIGMPLVRTVVRSVYGHVITKFSEMGRFTYPWCSAKLIFVLFHSVQFKVTILVRDVNDRPPLFQFHDYQSEIPEDTAVGSKVTVLVATDEDSAENTEVLTPHLQLPSYTNE